jgi:Zn-dependent M28 family amino/carboxypeptidase
MKPSHHTVRALLYPLMWPVIAMPGRSWDRPPKLSFYERRLRRQLEQIVQELSHHEIGERQAGNLSNLQAAEALITNRLKYSSYQVKQQPFSLNGTVMNNLEAEVRGKDLPKEIIVVGAHVDTVFGSRCADDNASGVAVLLMMAERLRLYRLSHTRFSRTVRFVFFGNEGSRAVPGETMGSYAYAKRCRERGENIVGMISLEMLGFYCDEPGSQRYPVPFNLFYPDVGNFVGFVGNLQSRRWVRKCIGTFREICHFPSEGVAAPAFLADINRSDRWSFGQFGYPAVMVTDTSNFRNRFPNTSQDTAGTLNFDKMARVTDGLTSMVAHLLSNRP